ncbi:MAG: diguanylate cyclase [Deltaproteobacteria bacterium]|nr:diguanylate cyclase [Deltaproteobacteria bacterium]
MTAAKKKHILIVDCDHADTKEIQQMLEQKKEFMVSTADTLSSTAISMYSAPPDVIIVNTSLEGGKGLEFCHKIKSDVIFGYIPIILLIDSVKDTPEIDWDGIPADDFIKRPFCSIELLNRVSMTLTRTERMWDANPLTRLPGNHTIIREFQKRIDLRETFTVAYVDLDNFKSYNDKYGFLKGDNVLKFTARLIANHISELNNPHETFIGHLGGDDFVFIVPPDNMDDVCKRIIENFDAVIGDFYDADDAAQGFITTLNRKGGKEGFPIMTVSIAIISNDKRHIRHIGEISTTAAELKSHAKSIKGSKFIRDLRTAKKK